MSKKKPDKVYSVDGVIVLARSPKGAVSVAKALGHAVADLPTVAEMPEAMKAQAVNRRT